MYNKIKGLEVRTITVNNIKLERLKLDLLQKDIAEILDLNVNTYCKKENNPRTFTAVELVKLSKFYNKTIDYLVENI